MPTPTETLFDELGMDAAAVAWAAHENRSIAVAWATCPRADWLVEAAARLGCARTAVVAAARECVAIALPMAAGMPSGLRAFDATLRWVEGLTTESGCAAEGVAAREAALRAAVSDPYAAAALLAAAHLAFACDAHGDASAWAEAGHAVAAVRFAMDATAAATERLTAERVLDHLHYGVVAPRVASVVPLPAHSGIRALETRVVETYAPRVVATKTRGDL